MTSAGEQNWTTRTLLKWMGDAFKKRELDDPRRLAEMLVAHVLSCDRLKLYMDADRPASPLERSRLRDLVGRALNHEPIQYLVGEEWFYGMAFKVDRRVLIPRPATETIVDHVLNHARATFGKAGDGVLFADVCTGSGCVAITLLKNLPGARAIATDISPDALDVARENARRHGVDDRMELILGDLLSPVREHPVAGRDGALQYLVSNPPYIPDDEWGAVAPNVKDHEPHLALRGGADGLDYVRRLLDGGPELLRADGLMLIEVADSRARHALALAEGVSTLAEARVLNDFEGLPRVVVAARTREPVAVSAGVSQRSRG
jgi:release factor glutamine methyltransferase